MKFRKHSVVILSFIFCVVVYATYRIYLWTLIESTDNAYVASRISVISSEISGVVKEVFVDDNSLISDDTIIAKVDDRDYIAAHNKALSAYDVAKYNLDLIDKKIAIAELELSKNKKLLESSQAKLDIANDVYKRTKFLSKGNVVAKNTLDDVGRGLENAKTDINSSLFNVELSANNLELLKTQKMLAISNFDIAKQDVDISELNLSKTIIRGKVSGKIANSNLRVGNYLVPGMQLFYVVPQNSVYLEANFKETQVARIAPGMSVKIFLDTYKDIEVTGTVRNITPASSAKFSLIPTSNATGNFVKIVQRIPVLIDFEIPTELTGRVLPGMSAYATVLIKN